MKLLILDGNSIVNRAFYGVRMLNAPDGTPTNGVYGFLSILHKLLDDGGGALHHLAGGDQIRHMGREYVDDRHGIPPW